MKTTRYQAIGGAGRGGRWSIGAPLAALAQNATNAPPTNAAAASNAAAANAPPTATNAAAPAAAAPAPSPCAATNNCATQTYPKDSVNSGDTAWMLTSSVLVLMMTIPGLALFYAGMVRKKNILDTLAQSFGATCVITVLWMIIGYSIAFTGHNPYIGDFKYILLAPLNARHQHRQHGSGADHSRDRVHVLPDDVRDHHAGADRRRGGRPDEVLGLPAGSWACG